MSSTTSNINSVTNLKEIQFANLPLEKQLEIKAIGRPTPKLHINVLASARNKEYFRKFSPNMYRKCDWICGCEVKNAFFCFPCLLFKSENDVWSKNGCARLRSLPTEIKKHDMTFEHKDCMINFSLIVPNSRFKSITDHELYIDKNRELLSNVINEITSLSTLQSILVDPNGSTQSVTVNLSKVLLEQIQSVIQSTMLHSVPIQIILNELLQCILEVYREEILKEIENVDFISIIGLETYDVSMHESFVLILRYVNKFGCVVERFWGFSNVPVVSYIPNELKKIIPDQRNKLVAQSYNNGALMSNAIDLLQEYIKSEYVRAQNFNCENHNLFSAMEKTMSQNKKAREFFLILHTIPEFFSRFPHASSVLNKCFTTGYPGVKSITFDDTCQSSSSITIKQVFLNKDILLECFEALSDNARETDVVVRLATQLKLTMRDPGFNNLLDFFYKFINIIIQFQLKLPKLIYTENYKTHLIEFISLIESFIELNLTQNLSVSSIECNEHVTTGHETQMDQPPRSVQVIAVPSPMLVAAIDVCNLSIRLAKQRSSFSSHLELSLLFSIGKFKSYNNKFPLQDLYIVAKMFPYLDRSVLETELKILYNRNEFRSCKTPGSLLEFIVTKNLQAALAEVVKLLKIFMTISSNPNDKCLNTQRYVKNFLCNTTDSENLTVLATLAIEKSYIQHIKNFNQKVMNKFTSQESRKKNFCCNKDDLESTRSLTVKAVPKQLLCALKEPAPVTEVPCKKARQTSNAVAADQMPASEVGATATVEVKTEWDQIDVKEEPLPEEDEDVEMEKLLDATFQQES